MLVSLVSFLFVILVCVMIHEAGHYLSAITFGVCVHEFSFGMGPLLWQKQGKKNKWSVRAIPVGGFVRMGGMGEEDGDEIVPPGTGFEEKPAWQRFIILAAGAFNNILLAVVLAGVLLSCHGVMDLSVAKVGGLMQGYPAQLAGLHMGDVVTEVDGVAVNDWDSMTSAIRKSAGSHDSVVLRVKRGEHHLVFEMGTKKDEETGRLLIGIRPWVRKLTFIESVRGSVRYTFELMSGMLRGLLDIIRHPEAGDLAGPVGIASIAGQAARNGFYPLLTFLMFISLNLGIINLLPFPALDGGRLIFVFVEMITRRKLPPEVEGRIHMAGFIALALLFVLITWQDILKLF